jgi:putative polyhydroxyalkanoate system protein
MPTIVVHRKHALGLAGARRLAESIARKLREDYGGSFAWEGDDLRFQRTGRRLVAVTKGGFQVLEASASR